ncbi:MAG: hypothetical protein ACFCVC_09365 [Acidimicrobiia bacterium]
MIRLIRSRLSGGLVDAGMASIATFVTGLYVILEWADTPEFIGVYAIFFAAFGMATTVTTQLVFIPAEKVILDLPAGIRRRLAPAISWRLLPVALACAALVVVVPSVMVLATGEYDQLVLPLALTAFVVFVVSPIQDHLRRLFHLDQSAWQAARVSIVQAVGSVLAVAVLHFTIDDPAWIAFGGLAVANIASTVYGLIGARHSTRRVAVDEEVASRFFDDIAVRVLTRMGWWLGTAGALSTGANLLVAGLISAVAGEAALGYAEAARTLAQPIVVVSMGLRSVYGPDSMRTARLRDREGAARVSKTFMVVLWPMTVLYAAIVGWDWAISPLPDLVPAAYFIPGLIAVSVVANGFNGASFPLRLELVGADRERALFMMDTLSNVVMVVVSVVFAWLGAGSLALAAMARPAGMAALGLARWVSYRAAMVPHYREKAASV